MSPPICRVSRRPASESCSKCRQRNHSGVSAGYFRCHSNRRRSDRGWDRPGGSTVNRTVEGTTIREFPLNGRDWTQLATLQPGITSIGSGGGAGRDGSGVKLTVSGARPTENNFRLDGISLNDSSNTTPGSILGTNMGVESVREFSVVSNNYSAEYGRSTGAVVERGNQSGTNAIRGTIVLLRS